MTNKTNTPFANILEEFYRSAYFRIARTAMSLAEKNPLTEEMVFDEEIEKLARAEIQKAVTEYKKIDIERREEIKKKYPYIKKADRVTENTDKVEKVEKPVVKPVGGPIPPVTPEIKPTPVEVFKAEVIEAPRQKRKYTRHNKVEAC